MTKLTEKVYFSLPYSLQNIAVSILGLKLKRERYGNHSQKKVFEISKEYQSKDTKSVIDRCFVEIAKHAVRNTTFYKELARREKFGADDIRGIEDINRFPVINKHSIIENPESFILNDSRLRGGRFHLYTSGTTGTPLKVTTDIQSRQEHYAFFSSLRAEYGVKTNDRRATIMGRVITTQEEQRHFWRHDYFNKNLLFSSYHLSENNIELYYEKLISYSPDEIFSYPSSLYEIALWMLAHKKPKIRLKLIILTAERFLQNQANAIRSAFDAPIVDQYGCTEMMFFGTRRDVELPMRLNHLHGYSEVLDTLGSISSRGQGTHIATGFINYSMPIIRYNTGDNISLEFDSITGTQNILDMDGRKDDLIITKDGRKIGRLDPIFKSELNIKYAQIIQSPDLSLTINIVPLRTFSDQNEKILREELEKRIGKGMILDIILVDDIERTNSGKFRPVISHAEQN
ncbi:exopolysaccharide biosynthesis protein VpsH [Simiduia litorea]|uniref:hypothetical protein n=1 Tax=Simiduia litorea TaxID=1435348 RepID=UPI0036F19731